MDLYARDIGAEFKDVTGFDATVGGSLTNIVIGPGRLGLTSIAFTAVGNDLIGEFVLRYLEDDGVAEHLPSSETRALLLSGNAFSRGACIKAATFCTEAGQKAGLSTTMELDLRPSERLQPGGYGPSQ